MPWWRKSKATPPKSLDEGASDHAIAVDLSDTPDAPVAFGYKSSWFAVRADSAAEVAAALGAWNLRPANWKSGVDASYEKHFPTAFFSPPVDGWVLVLSFALPYPNDGSNDWRGIRSPFYETMGKLASSFSAVAFFATHRVGGLDAWAFAENGELVRAFTYADSEVLANLGAQTNAERKLALPDLTGLSAEEATEELARALDQHYGQDREDGARNPCPNEEDTLALAAAWSLDPLSLYTRREAIGVGLFGEISPR